MTRTILLSKRYLLRVVLFVVFCALDRTTYRCNAPTSTPLYYRIAALRPRDSGAPHRLVTAVRGCGVPTRALRHVRPADDEMAHYHDSSVSIVSADKVLTSDAYMLSYAKRGVVGVA